MFIKHHESFCYNKVEIQKDDLDEKKKNPDSFESRFIDKYYKRLSCYDQYQIINCLSGF